MLVTCTLADTTDATKHLTLGSVDGTLITSVTDAAGAPTRTINGQDLTLATTNVNNVGFTPSTFLTLDAKVLEPSGSNAFLTVDSHPTEKSLVIVTINAVARTLNAAELKDGIANCLRNT